MFGSVSDIHLLCAQELSAKGISRQMIKHVKTDIPRIH